MRIHGEPPEGKRYVRFYADIEIEVTDRTALLDQSVVATNHADLGPGLSTIGDTEAERAAYVLSTVLAEALGSVPGIGGVVPFVRVRPWADQGHWPSIVLPGAPNRLDDGSQDTANAEQWPGPTLRYPGE